MEENKLKKEFIILVNNFINNQTLVNYLKNERSMDESNANQALERYANYLYLLHKYEEKLLPPSYDIQIAWQAHNIADLDKFVEMKKLLNENYHLYLNYRDYFINKKFKSKLDKDSYEETRKLYFGEFNSQLPAIGTINFYNKNKEKIFYLIKQLIYYLLFFIVVLIIFLWLNHILRE